MSTIPISRGVRVGWALATAMLAGCSEPPPRPRNLLVISVDTLRADAIGAAGRGRLREIVRTPNIDRLVAEGTYFTSAFAPMPRTTPALASLLTGLWPQHHGSRDVGDPILEVVTLAEILKQHGFATLAMSTNNSAGPKQGLDRGFDHFATYSQLIDAHGDGLYRDLTDVPPDNLGWASASSRRALELIDRAPPGQPYFLWVFYFDPHFLYRPPSPWQDEVEAEQCWQLYEYFSEHRRQAGQVFSDVGGVASEAMDACRRLYAAEVAYTDHEIGLLLSALRDRGRLDGTVVVFVADHGENFGEGGLFFEHGDNAHDAGLRVPLIFSGPGIEPAKRDGGAVSLVDVMPTALALLGLPVPDGLDGCDLSPRLRLGEAAGRGDRRSSACSPPGRRVVFAESATAVWNEAVEHVTTGRTWWRVCINGPRYTLCEIPKEAPGVYALYDHVADPALSEDVAAAHPEVVAALLQAWQSWPPESARQRVAQTAEFKLVETPRLEGGYQARLYHLPTDPQETADVSAEHPDVFRHLRAALAEWADDLPDPPERLPDPELEEVLRTLGYVP